MIKNTIEYVREVVESKGCILFDKEYVNQDFKLKIKFSCGHISYRSFQKFKELNPVCPKCSGKIKNNYQDVVLYIKNNNYKLNSKEYLNCKTYMEFEDKEGYLYEMSYDQFKFNVVKRKTNPSKWKNNSYALYNISLFLEKNYPFLKLMDNQIWDNSNKKLFFVDKNGYKYSFILSSLFSHAKNDARPPLCDTGNLFSMDNMILWCKINKKSFYPISNQKYVGSTSKMKFKCEKCHKDEMPFVSCWTDIQSGRGCGICSSTQIGKYNNLEYLYPEISKEWDYSKNGKITPSEVPSHTDKKFWWKCLDCKNSYIRSVSHKTASGRIGCCPYCIETRGEKIIRRKLESNKINIISQYRFKDCKNKNPLPFDFYLPDYDMCIEYHGRQHYEPVEFFGGKKNFNEQRKRDKIKERYCKENNIPLLVIPYWEFDNIEKILEENLFP